MGIFFQIFFVKRWLGRRTTYHVKIAKEQKWDDSKNGNCAKLPGSYWLYRESNSVDSDRFHKETPPLLVQPRQVELKTGVVQYSYTSTNVNVAIFPRLLTEIWIHFPFQPRIRDHSPAGKKGYERILHTHNQTYNTAPQNIVASPSNIIYKSGPIELSRTLHGLKTYLPSIFLFEWRCTGKSQAVIFCTIIGRYHFHQEL